MTEYLGWTIEAEKLTPTSRLIYVATNENYPGVVARSGNWKTIRKEIREYESQTPGYHWGNIKDYTLPQKLINDFHQQIITLAKKVFGTDGDGDLPVSIKVIDRTRYEPDHFFSIPYDHKIKTKEESDQRLDLINTNLKMASEKLQNELRRRQFEKYNQ